MRILLIFALAGIAFGQSYNIVDTAPYPIGNPAIPATCNALIAAPQITSGTSTWWAVPYPYSFTGSIALWLQPASVVYKITGNCSYQQPSQATKINQCWLVPSTCTALAPCTVAEIVAACPGTSSSSGSTGDVLGTGTAGSLALWTLTNTIGNSTLTDVAGVLATTDTTLTLGVGSAAPSLVAFSNPTPYASLGAPTAATFRYCGNCSVGNCATPGTGALAFWNPGTSTWSCIA